MKSFFYKKVKSMIERDQPYCPITTIKEAQGQIITDKHHIKQRWGGYFEGLLNPNEDTIEREQLFGTIHSGTRAINTKIGS